MPVFYLTSFCLFLCPSVMICKLNCEREMPNWNERCSGYPNSRRASPAVASKCRKMAKFHMVRIVTVWAAATTTVVWTSIWKCAVSAWLRASKVATMIRQRIGKSKGSIPRVMNRRDRRDAYDKTDIIEIRTPHHQDVLLLPAHPRVVVKVTHRLDRHHERIINKRW